MDKGRPLPRHLWSALFYRWTWQMAWRDSRKQRQRLLIFSLSLVAGISALVAIHSLKASVESAIQTQAKTLLGSDLQISSRRPYSREDTAKIHALAPQSAEEISFSSMLYFPSADAARLVQVRGLHGDFPFYGKVETAPATAWEDFQAGRGVLLEPTLLDQFQSKVGDRVRLGSMELPIIGTVTKPPPRSSRFSGFAPEAYVPLEALPKTGLLGTSSLSFYHLHLRISPSSIPSLKQQFAERGWKFESAEQRQENLGKALENFERFLGLVALVALILGAIGVASAIYSHIQRRIATVAILRCLGCPDNLAFGIYVCQAAVLGVLGAITGALVGLGLHFTVLSVFRESLPFAIDSSPRWPIIFQTTATGFLVCCGFAILPLLKIRGVSPSATLREDSSAGRTPYWQTAAVCALVMSLVTGMSRLSGTPWNRALAMTGGLTLAFATLAAIAWILIIGTRRALRPSWPYLLRQGISNLYRPHNQTLLFLLSLGLGSFLLLTLLLTKNLLMERISVSDPGRGPNLYLVDVQRDQIAGVRELLRSLELPQLESAPMVTMRIKSVKGVPISELENQEPKKTKPGDEPIPKWILQREFRSSYRAGLSPTETLIAGQWWDHLPDPAGPIPLSLEEEIAKDLKVGLGDQLVLDVQGIEINARVTSLRKVDWSRFNLNFFMVFPPGVLESAPGFEVITTRIPKNQSSGVLQRALALQFPNVSAIDLSLILQTVASILDRISRVIQILAGFTVVAGIPILIGTLLNGRDQRIRESVLLRTLGAASAQVRAIFIIEYVSLGALSAASGIALAVAANWALATFLFDASPWPDPWLLLSSGLIVTTLALLAGLGLSRGVCHHPPLQILRRIG